MLNSESQVIYTQIKHNTKRTIYPEKSIVSAYILSWVIRVKYVLSNCFKTLGMIYSIVMKRNFYQIRQ